MAILDQSKRLKKELSLLSVYAIATGTTLSAGFFLLPGLAVAESGPAVVLSYLIAAALMVPAMLSTVELATAMPRAGGAYYFLDRSLGPLAGTIGGMGTWFALTLKTAFALVGMGAYIRLFFHDAPVESIAIGFAVFFGAVNVVGAKATGRFQIVLVVVLLAILIWFISAGTVRIDATHFDGFFDKGGAAIFSTAGLVFISYVGVTKVASVSEEVKDPERNLPLGIFLALGTAVIIYGLGVTVMVGVVPMDVLTSVEHQLTPVAAAAETFAGRVGVGIVSIAAILAFFSVANGGIMSSSRYPLAMSRDHLLPGFFGAIGKTGTPVRSILFTVAAVIAYVVFLDPLKIAKLASAFQLLMFSLLCLAVIVMRESRIQSYDPGYRSPLYPYLHIVGFVAPFVIIAEMGWVSILFTGGMIAAGMLWYFHYASGRIERHGAIYHVFERLGRGRFDDLDVELRGIMKEKGLREEDPFDEVVTTASVIEAEAGRPFEELVERASALLAGQLECDGETLIEGFMQGTRIGATPVTGGIALPHLRRRDADRPLMIIARAAYGIDIPVGDVHGAAQPAQRVHAVFFLISPESDPGQHLRLLAQLASRVDQEGFIDEWLAAADELELKEAMLRHDRYLSVRVGGKSRTHDLIGCALRDLEIPEGCLVALIRRGERSIVPRGKTVLGEGDRLTLIGEPEGIRELYERYGEEPTKG